LVWTRRSDILLLGTGGPRINRQQNFAAVKLLETVTGPSEKRHFRQRVKHGATDGTIDEQADLRRPRRGGAAVRRPGARAVIQRRRPPELLRQHLHRDDFEREPNRPVWTAAGHLGAGADRARGQRRATALERRGRRLRPSPDERERDPRGGGEFR